MLEAAGFKVVVGGNIGAPVSGQVDDSTPETLHVVETSSFQLEQIDTFRPWIAVMLNFSPDHLDRHPDVASYAAAKARIFANQDADDLGGGERRRSGGARSGAPTAAHGAGMFFALAATDQRRHGRRATAGSSIAGARADDRAPRAARRDPPAGPHIW